MNYKNLVDMSFSNKDDGFSFGFTTAGGSSINVSEKALSKARKLFADELEEADSHEETSKIENETDIFEAELSNIGFQTANGQCINVTNEALLKAKALLLEEEIPASPENDLVFSKPLQKRKMKDLDENVTLNKQTKRNHFKKLRFSDEFQSPKIALKCSSVKEKENLSVSLQAFTSNCDIDEMNDNNDKIRKSKETNETTDNSLISHEILASAAALLADENDLDFTEQWTVPKEVKESEEDNNVPSSPVIGGQFIPKKRKIMGGRRKSTNALKNKEIKTVCVDNLKKLNDNSTSSNSHIDKETVPSMEIQELTDIEKNCDSLITNEFSDTQLMLDFINQSTTILEKRIEAALDQDKQISLKRKNKPKPTISKLYFYKKIKANNQKSWREISKGNKPILCTYEELIERKLPTDILDITADNAMGYKFRCANFYGEDVQNNIDGIKLEDGACLILDENGYAGIIEIKRSFLASPGVDPNLVPNGWVENHYKWIIWKLASVDRIKLGSITLPRALTPARVMMELKYRYDREIDRFQRPALRRILEKDDVASKRMVLCVSSIIEGDDSTAVSESPNQLKTPSMKLVLTDGWYSVQASLDQAMIKYIVSGKVKEGTKLLTYGCELLNCDQGYAPLEVPEKVCLKLHTNSTRRARWDTKLGYIVPSGPMCIKLKTILPNGGLIGKIKVIVARVYPMLYHEKTLAGESIFRSARCEEKANIAYEKECRSMIEAFYAKAEKYFYTGKNKNNLDTDSIDLAAIEWNEDYEKLSREEFFSERELQQLQDNCRTKEEKFRQKLESRLQESLPPSRQVTPVLKIRIVEENTSAILSIWSPSEEVTDILKEGTCVSICNIMPSTKRGNELQLTASRNALFSQINISNISFPQRTYTALCDINKSTFAPAYGEFDTVGIVVFIGNEPYGMKNFQAMYLACPYVDSQSYYLSILFWQGMSSYGYAEILTIGSFIACNNLEWRRSTSRNIPMAYCCERSTFTRNPRQSYLQQPFEDLKRSITDPSAYIDQCAAEISEEIQKKSTMRISDQYTPERNSFDKITPKDKQFNNRVLQELSGRSLINNEPAKSVAIQKRLEKLQSYGEPSSLSPIVLNNSSRRVSLEFQSPLRSRIERHTKARTSLNTKFIQNPR